MRGVVAEIVFGRLVDVAQLPREQPRVADAVCVHVGHEAVFIALMPAHVLVRIDEFGGSGHEEIS